MVKKITCKAKTYEKRHKNALELSHKNLEKDYKDFEIKKELLSNEKNINNGTISKDDSLLTSNFIDDLDKAVDLT